jgi:hypothetical protein
VVRVTVAGTAPHSSAFPRSRPLFPITHRCSGEDATTSPGPVKPEHGRALPRHGRRPGAHAAKLLHSIQSICVASAGPPGFQEAGAPLCRPSSGRSSPAYRHALVAVCPRRRQGCSGAVALGKSTCLGVVLGGERGGVLGLVGGAGGGVNPLVGARGSPLPYPSFADSGSRLADTRARAGIGSGRARLGRVSVAGRPSSEIGFQFLFFFYFVTDLDDV